MTKRFAPDLDDTPTLEIPDLRLKAQHVLHMMIGADISAEEYLEKLEIIQTALKEVYQEAVSLTMAQHEFRFQQLEKQLRRSTHRPAKTEPGMGPPSIPPPPPVPDLDIDWGEYADSEDAKD